MSEIKFGTDGWRAIIAKDFTVENVSRVAYATAEWRCIVEANSKEEAEEKVWAGDYEELNNGDPTRIEDEQIESIVETEGV